MAYAFDTLGYSKKLQAAGIAATQADAHAEAARDFIMTELVTKSDLAAAMEALSNKLTLRLGSIVVAGIAALAALQHLH